ncbi:hypothetical protein TKK_0007592 [Trichogramma kaykai]
MARRIPRRRSPRLNNVETRKISCHSKRRTHRIRQRSAEPDKSKTERDLFITFQKKPRPVTVASMESVIYLGNYQKIPEVVTLDDGSDDESHKTEPYKQKLRSYKNSNRVNFNDAVSNRNNSKILPSNGLSGKFN